MAVAVLLALGLVTILTAVVFGAAALQLISRPVVYRRPVRAMATWWTCMGGVLLLQGGLLWAAAAGYRQVAGFTLARYANGPLLALAGWGLCFHVRYLYTGRERQALPLAIFYAFVAAAYVTTVILHPITALEMGPLGMVETYSPPLDGDPLWNIVLAAVGLPLIIAAVAYLRLVPNLERRDQKRRAILVSCAILLWVGSGLVVQLVGGIWADFVTYTVLGLVTAVLVILAYFPPAALTRKDPPEPIVPSPAAPALRKP